MHDRDETQDVLEQFEYDGWEVATDGATLTCPHGNTIELDGHCPEGCESPLLSLGLI